MESQKYNKRKNINDPVHGFITIPGDLVFDVMEHPWFQRLRRIKQLGLTYYVYPSAVHTRFQHALGAMHLMLQAIEVLRAKGVAISAEEAEAVVLAILLHDVGHGPYSHTLEKSIVKGISHEELSLLIIRAMNKDLGNRLSMALDIFLDFYPRHFLHQLVSSQLDMDRLDYLIRDSFFTGVAEGVISTGRIIKMLNVYNDELVVDVKGIYSIENFIIARRLMYWQVYLHKTVVGADFMLINILRRAKKLAKEGAKLFATPALHDFLYHDVTKKELEQESKWLSAFSRLDDYDVFTSIKVWTDHPDPILSMLSRNLIGRRLFHTELRSEPIPEEKVERVRKEVIRQFGVSPEDAAFLLVNEVVENSAYSTESDKIRMLFPNGDLMDVSQASDQLNISVLSATVSKYVLCYPKGIL